MRMAFWVLLLPALAVASTDSKGSVGFEGRAFVPEGDEVDRFDYGSLLVGRLEWKGKQKPFREKLRVVGRAAAIDRDRSRLVVEEAWVGYRSKYLRLKAGVQLLNWTATEAFHPADVVNSRNFDGNVENPDKVGEPMVSATLRLGRVHLTGYYLPVRMDPVFPGPRSRLSFSGTKLGDPLWVPRGGGDIDDLEDSHFEHQWAVRLATTLGSADIALHAIQHNDRSQPGLAINQREGTARPVYAFVTQVGMTYAHAVSDFLLKLEAAHRRPDDLDVELQFPVAHDGNTPATLLLSVDPPNHTIVAAGVEYGWSYDTLGQATVIVEGQGVVDVADADERKAITPFQRDVLVGYRHDFEDVQGTTLNLGVIVDLEGDGVVGTGSVGRRLGETWTLATSLRLNFIDDGPLEPLDGDHFMQLELIRHF